MKKVYSYEQGLQKNKIVDLFFYILVNVGYLFLLFLSVVYPESQFSLLIALFSLMIAICYSSAVERLTKSHEKRYFCLFLLYLVHGRVLKFSNIPKKYMTFR